MKLTGYVKILAAVMVIVTSVAPSLVKADPCLVVYPTVSCVYRYDSSEYYTVEPGHPLYDPDYDRGGEVLLETGTDEIDLSIYQVPSISGFEPSVDGEEGYLFSITDFSLVIDGFSNKLVTYVNILLVFDEVTPDGCTPSICIEGELLSGNVYSVGDLVVSTPTPHGNNYSDTITLDINWSGCDGVHIWAFSDEDYDGVHDGGECFTAFSHDATLPTRDSSWSEIKSKFR
jgi:hypothetical protein